MSALVAADAAGQVAQRAADAMSAHLGAQHRAQLAAVTAEVSKQAVAQRDRQWANALACAFGPRVTVVL